MVARGTELTEENRNTRGGHGLMTYRGPDDGRVIRNTKCTTHANHRAIQSRTAAKATAVFLRCHHE